MSARPGTRRKHLSQYERQIRTGTVVVRPEPAATESRLADAQSDLEGLSKGAAANMDALAKGGTLATRDGLPVGVLPKPEKH